MDACKPEITDRFGCFEGDLFLVCSDGLTEMLDDAAISDILGKEAPIAAKATMLIYEANENGGEDNISVLLIEVKAT